MIHFTSDEHHFHQSIIDYCKQPFSDVESKMNTIISNHNKMVNEEDTVIHCGDFSCFLENVPMIDEHEAYELLKETMKKYKKVKERILIIGNHDEFSFKEYRELGFDTVKEYMTFDYELYTFFACHDPSFYQPKIYDRIGVCGHVHSLFKTIPGKQIFNASVDVNNYMPISIKEVIRTLKTVETF